MARRLALLLAALPGTALAQAPDAAGGTGQLVGLGAVVLVCAVLVATRRAWGLMASAVAGMLAAGWLYLEHGALEAGAAGSCKAVGAFTCKSALSSPYAEIAGVPIALLGLAYFAGMAFLAWRNASGQNPLAPAAMSMLAALAVAYDVFLAVITFTRLEGICPFCATTWALNVLLLVGALLEFRTPDRVEAVRGAFAKDGLSTAIVGLGALVLVGMIGRSGTTPAASAEAGSGDLSEFYEEPAGRIELDGTEPVKGNPSARFTIVEWADFECPHCAMMYKDLDAVVRANPDVKLLYKHYPITQICNRFVEGERHLNACNAAAASECARQQGRFWELAGDMFKNQEYLGKDDLRFMVRHIGIDEAAFEACMANPATAEAVRMDVEAGGIAGVQGTPSIYLQGAFGDAWVRLTGREEEINAILAAARQGTPLPSPPPPSDR